MKRISQKRIIELLTIIILGLVPLLWFKGNNVVLGHDAGLPISPIEHFIDRFYLWTNRYGIGHDQTYALPGLFIHGIEAMISYFGLSLQWNQKITFVFWFMLPGLTMYYLTSRLESKTGLKFLALPSSMLYMMNHYLMQGWFIAERTKFSLYAALPLLLAFLIDWQEKKLTTLKTGILISLTLFFLNGMASLPLFGAIIIALVVFLGFYFYWDKSRKEFLRLVKLILVTIITSLALQSYWLLAYIHYVRNSYSEVVGQAGGVSGVLGWIAYISKDTSLINLMRLQGIPEWYQNPDHAYANVFLHNPVFILISFLLPFVAFCSLFYIKDQKKRKYILFFNFLALFSMIFTAGSHPPFGGIYNLLVQLIPGFIAFRTPFYKFAPALWLSMSILIGFTISSFIRERFVKPNYKFFLIFSISLSIGLLFYNFPFLDGRFFDYIKNQRSMRVNIPSYVLDFGRWSSSVAKDGKILPLPPAAESVESFSWGYWSLTPVTSLLTNASIINPNGMTVHQKEILTEMFSKMKKKDSDWLKVAKVLGIRYFLVRKDFIWNSPSSMTDNPKIYEEVLNNTSGIVFFRKFGEWSIYTIEDLSDEIVVYKEGSLSYIEGAAKDLPVVISIPGVNTESVYYVSGTYGEKQDVLLNNSKNIFVIPQCVMCFLQPQILNEGAFVPSITADSILFPIIKTRESQKEKAALVSPEQSVEYYLELSLRRQKGLERAADEKKLTEALDINADSYLEALQKLRHSLVRLINIRKLENNELLMKGYTYLYIQSNNVIAKSSLLANAVDKQLLNQVFSEIDKTLTLIKNSAWYTENLRSKKYIFTVPKDGGYTAYLNNDTLSENEIIINRPINLSIDDKAYSVTASEENSWFSLVDIFLTKGRHTLLLEDVPLKNLYPNPSQIISVIDEDRESFACFKSVLIPTESGGTYDINIQYRQLRGSGVFYFHPLGRDEILPALSKPGIDLKNSSNWEQLRMDFQSSNNNGFYFYICTRPHLRENRRESVLEVRSVTIQKITEPKIVFWHKPLEDGEGVSRINADLQNQTSYKFSTTEDLLNRTAVLNQAFNYNWELDRLSHVRFTANGYANGWFITSSGNSGIIKYAPQKYVKWGFIISICSFLVVNLVMLIKRNEKKH